jgi:hypothetical protein
VRKEGSNNRHVHLASDDTRGYDYHARSRRPNSSWASRLARAWRAGSDIPATAHWWYVQPSWHSCYVSIKYDFVAITHFGIPPIGTPGHPAAERSRPGGWN